MRGSVVSAALFVGLAQAGPVPPTKTTEDRKRSPQFEWVGRPSTGITIPGQPIQPPRCDPRIHGICVVRPPKRDVDDAEPDSEAVAAVCDPRFIGICVTPRPGGSPSPPPHCDPRIHGICVVRPPKRDVQDEEPEAAPAVCDPRIQGLCVAPRPGRPPIKRETAGQPEDIFNLPPSESKRKEVIKLIEGELQSLQNKPNKTKADLAAIDALRAYLRKVAGIVYISSPDGSVTIFFPGKRSVVEAEFVDADVEKRQTLGKPGGPSSPKEVIKRLEKQLQALQAKKTKSADDLEQISALKAALRYLAGITEITGPSGGTSTFVPGKRQSDTEKAIKELQRQLLALQNKQDKDDGDVAMIAALQAMIKYTQGITQITAPPGVNTTLTIPGGGK